MRFLYLSISADHACSSPSRQAFTRRSSLHPVFGPCVSSRLVPVTFSRRATGPLLTPEQFLDVPEGVGIEDCRPKVAQPFIGTDENVGADQEDKWQVLRDELLHRVVEPLARGRVEGRELTPHQRVDLGL